MKISCFWPNRTDAKYVEFIRENTTGWRRKLAILILIGGLIFWLGTMVYARSLQARAVDTSCAVIENFAKTDADADVRNQVMEPLMWLLAITAGYFWISFFMMFYTIVSLVVVLRDRRSRLLVKYYDLVLRNGLLDSELESDQI